MFFCLINEGPIAYSLNCVYFSSLDSNRLNLKTTAIVHAYPLVTVRYNCEELGKIKSKYRSTEDNNNVFIALVPCVKVLAAGHDYVWRRITVFVILLLEVVI